jgi:hypothetical protein
MEEVKQKYHSLSHSKGDCKYHVGFIPPKSGGGLCSGKSGAIFHYDAFPSFGHKPKNPANVG